MDRLDRRFQLMGGGLALGAAACSRPLSAAGTAGQTLLPIPPLIDAREQGLSMRLRAQAGKTSFFPGRPSDTLGYNASYLGPTLRVHSGDEVKVAVTNSMAVDTTVHWHGLLIPGELDGGLHQIITPGATWRPTLPIH